LPARVQLAEISGSDTFVHVDSAAGELVAQLPGVHDVRLAENLTLHLSAARAFVFGVDGGLLHAPPRRTETARAASPH
jgi:glycerol transport system ATP-binding protein